MRVLFLSLTPTKLLHYSVCAKLTKDKLLFHSKVDGFKINYLKK